MTESSHENSERFDPPHGRPPEGSDRPERAEIPEAACPAPETDLSELEDLDSFRTLVDEIKERLADLAEREDDLRRREDDCARQQELLQHLGVQTPLQSSLDPAAPGLPEQGGGLEKIGAAAAALDERERELERRAVALESKREKLRSVARKLEQRRAELTHRDAELQRREEEIARRNQQGQRLLEQADSCRARDEVQEQELPEIRRRLAAREASLNLEAAALEAERRQLQEESRTLETERRKLAELQLEPEELLTGGVGALRMQVVAAVPREAWRRRKMVLAVVVGLAAGILWYLVDRPLFRAVAEVQVTTSRGALKRVAREHADGVLSSELDRYFGDSALLEAWQAARDNHRINARMLRTEGRFELSVEDRDPLRIEKIVAQALAAYTDELSQRPLEDFRSPREVDWLERRAALVGELERRRSYAAELSDRLADLPPAAERAEAQAAFDNSLEQFKTVVAELQRLREEAATLDSRAQPRGQVAPEVVQEAFASDPLYQEDLKEFVAEARQYRGELVVAMVLLEEPLQNLRKEVQALKTALNEQRDLRPPVNVLTVLDQALGEAEDFDGFLAEFTQGWRQRRESVERLKVDEQVVELVSRQTQALEAAGRLIDEARRVSNVLRTLIDGLAEDESAGTREMVVVSVLRGDLSRIGDRAAVMIQAAAAVNPEENFRLDAHDRQLRGLRARLQDRQERIRQNLQAEADRTARAAHEEEKTRLLGLLRVAEDERQGLMQKLVDNLQALRTLDDRYQEVREFAAELSAEKAAVARLETRLAELESERPETRRDELAVIQSRLEQPVGLHRVRNASFAAIGAWLAFVLLFTLGSSGIAKNYQVVVGADDSAPASHA